jgi:hypothetical protein
MVGGGSPFGDNAFEAVLVGDVEHHLTADIGPVRRSLNRRVRQL